MWGGRGWRWRVRRLRGKSRCSAELERTPRAQPFSGCHGNHIPPPPASPQTALTLPLPLSVSLLASLFFILSFFRSSFNLWPLFIPPPPFLLCFHALNTCATMHTQQAHRFQVHFTLLKTSNYRLFCIPMQSHRH